jgi:hypothetical protein
MTSRESMNSKRESRGLPVAAWLALALLSAHVARATTIERMSLAKMAQAAPLIVRARCAGISVAFDAGEIWTFTSFRIEETWRGDAPLQITVRLLGGTMGNVTSHVSGVPQFRSGEDVILFLQPAKRGDFSVVSWEQGTFRVTRDAAGTESYVTQDTASFATFDPATRRFRATGIRHMPLERFRARVQAALHNTRSSRP